MAAGLDLCSEGTYASLTNDVASGKVSAEALAAPLVHLYTTRALLGQFDKKGSTPWDMLGANDVATPEHRALALRMAEESLVLVHNNGALPLDTKTVSCIGVAGPRAMDEVALLGNYCGYSQGPSSVLAGFARAAGPGLRVTGWPELGDSDVLVICLGITANDEGEEGTVDNGAHGDRAQYGLPESQIKELRGYRSAYSNKKLVAVVFGCSPFDLKPVAELADAVIVAWYPGECGGEAIARTVLGLNNPSGRLPITYPKSYDDLPDFKDYALAGRTYRYAEKEPLYPFGYGLSYTTFEYSRPKADQLGVEVDVTNTGSLAGDEVVQVYVRAPQCAGDRRRHHLEGFSRVSLAPGETRRVRIAFKPSAFCVYGEDGRQFLPTEESTVFVGGGQPGFAKTVSVQAGVCSNR